MAYNILIELGLPVAVYEIEHFMQWGTPQDLAEYLAWSSIFRRLAVDDARRARQAGSVLVPAAGYGRRFTEAGYRVPKPLIPVSGRPMVIQATRDLPDAPVTRFVFRADMPQLDQIQLKLRTTFVGASVLALDHATDGQATTCVLGLEGLDLDAPVTIGACDNSMLYDPTLFEAEMEDGSSDVLAWAVRGHADGRLRPHMFGWLEVEADQRVTGVIVKRPPKDPMRDPMIVGAFTFKRAEHFLRAYDRLRERDGAVNGEFYIDSLIEDAVSIGLNVKLFEIDHYLGWGTPTDLRTFEYWQSCFHKWPGHPYRLERDRRVPPACAPSLAEAYAPAKISRPSRLLRASALDCQEPSATKRPRPTGANWLPLPSSWRHRRATRLSEAAASSETPTD